MRDGLFFRIRYDATFYGYKGYFGTLALHHTLTYATSAASENPCNSTLMTGSVTTFKQ